MIASRYIIMMSVYQKLKKLSKEVTLCVCLLGIIGIVCTGCRVKKTDIVQEKGEKISGEIVKVENAKGNKEKIVSQFLGISMEDLENCSKEEALQYCTPYAELLGYNEDNSEVEVYAITYEQIKNQTDVYAPIKGLENKKYYQ